MHQPQDNVHGQPHPQASGPGAARDDSAKTTPAADMQPEDASSVDAPDDEPRASPSPPPAAAPSSGAAPPREGPGREREQR